MTFQEYKKLLSDIPYTSGLDYRPAYIWAHTERLPQGLFSLNGCADRTIRIPPNVENRCGKMVPVVTIFKNAFRNNEAVTDIILPSGIGHLPDGAFAGCRKLRRITIPQKITYIGPGTFDRCLSLEDVYYEGSPEEWDRIGIVHEKHEIEFGALTPGSPVEKVIAERRIHIPGNDALFTANIHFYCAIDQSARSEFGIYMGGKDITGMFLTGRKNKGGHKI